MSAGPGLFRIFSTVTAIFAIGVVAVSGALLHQAIKYRDYYFYGNTYGGAGGGGYYGGALGGIGNGLSGYFGGGQAQYGQYGQYGYGSGGGGYGSGGGGYGDGDYGTYDAYRYHKVIAIASIALGIGLIQFFVSLMLCCVNGKSSRPLAIGYIAGGIFVLLVLIICFGLGFQYRIIYPFYFYNAYKAFYYTQYNPEGQAFCAILGIDIIYLIISTIVVGVFAKRSTEFDDPIEWQVRPATSSTAPVNDYGRDGMRTA